MSETVPKPCSARSEFPGRLICLPLLVLTRWGEAPVKFGAGNNFQENAKEFANAGDKCWCLCPSVLTVLNFYGSDFRCTFEGFLGGVWGSILIAKLGSRIPPQNQLQHSNQRLRAAWPKSTLQGSGLDHLMRSFQHELPIIRACLWAGVVCTASRGWLHQNVDGAHNFSIF